MLKMYYFTGVESDFFWPEMEQKEKEARQARRNTPLVFEATYQGRPVPEGGYVFKREHLHFYQPPPGPPSIYNRQWQDFLRSGTIISSWDTTLGGSINSDTTVGLTALLVSCSQNHLGDAEETEEHYDVYLLDVERGKLGFEGQMKAIRKEYKQWKPNINLMEKKATGDALIGSLKNAGINFVPIIPLIGKRQRATNGAMGGSAQGWMGLGRVFLPDPRAGEWYSWVGGAETPGSFVWELLNFTGKEGGSDDQVDAFTQLVNYAIELGSSGALVPDEAIYLPEGVPTTNAPYLDLAVLEAIDNKAPRDDFAWSPSSPLPNFNAYEQTCSVCKFYDHGFCRKHQIKQPAIATCIYFESGEESDDVAVWFGS